MKKQVLIDLSRSLENDVLADPPGFGPILEYRNHTQGASEVAALFPGLKIEELPDAEGWALERIHVTTHNGTHVDAPWH